MSKEYSPGDMEVAACVVNLWKTKPETNSLSYAKLLALVKAEKKESNWALSEKRLKAVLKQFNLAPQNASSGNRGFAQHITNSTSEVEFPPGIKLQVTKKRGRGLYTTKKFPKGSVLWTEKPMVIAPSLDDLMMMRNGGFCTYCGSLVNKSSAARVLAPAVRCSLCSSNWCSAKCKHDDIVHSETRHSTRAHNSRTLDISTGFWMQYEDFACKSEWFAAFLYGRALLHVLKHGRNSQFAKSFAGLASVDQRKRSEAFTPPNSFEFEQLELMWQEGHALLQKAVAPVYALSYDEFMRGVGCVNINNNSGRVFEKYSNINHSCDYNAEISRVNSLNDEVSVVACKDIEPNTEITTTYVNPQLGAHKRRDELLYWGFLCTCEKCKRELAE